MRPCPLFLLAADESGEAKTQLDAIRRGMDAVVPVTALCSVMSWRDIEKLVCGSAEVNSLKRELRELTATRVLQIDLSLLKTNTEHATIADPLMTYFWGSLDKFSHEQRYAVLLSHVG